MPRFLTHRKTVRKINVFYKLLSLGLVCYVTIGKQYSIIPMSYLCLNLMLLVLLLQVILPITIANIC
jgi:hypothetical protein